MKLKNQSNAAFLKAAVFKLLLVLGIVVFSAGLMVRWESNRVLALAPDPPQGTRGPEEWERKQAEWIKSLQPYRDKSSSLVEISDYLLLASMLGLLGPFALSLFWRSSLEFRYHRFVVGAVRFFGWSAIVIGASYGFYIYHYGLYTHKILRDAGICIATNIHGGSSTYFGFEAVDCKTRTTLEFLTRFPSEISFVLFFLPPERLEYEIDKNETLRIKIFRNGDVLSDQWLFDANTRSFKEVR